MKLIKNLGKIGKYYCGKFECSFCLQEVIKILCHGKRDKSCGCQRIKLIKQNSGNFKHGETKTKLYNVWVGIKQRILNKNSTEYFNYGGRGITICNEWLEFIPFRDWSLSNGYKESLTIDRKENDKDYSPENCHFVTNAENCRNKRNNKLTEEKVKEIRIKYNSGYYTQKQLSEEYHVSKRFIFDIIHFVWWK